MTDSAESLRTGVRRVVRVQTLMTAGVALVAGGLAWRAGAAAAAWQSAAAVYGGGIAILSAWWLGRRVARAGELARTLPARGQLSLYAGALERFVATLALLALGLGAFKLAPIPLIAAFGAAQRGFLANVANAGPGPAGH